MQRSDLNLLAEAYSSINNSQQIHEGISDILIKRAGQFLLKKLQQADPSAFKQLKQIVSSKDEQTLSNIINKPQIQKAINNFSQPIEESIIGDAGKIIKKIYNYFNHTPRGASMAAFIVGALCILSAIYIGQADASLDSSYDVTKVSNAESIQLSALNAKALMMYLYTVGIGSIGMGVTMKSVS